MGLRQIIAAFFIILFLPQFLKGNQDEAERSHILFVMQSGNTGDALELYHQYHEKHGRHDFELLQQVSLILLDQGYRTKNPEIQLLTLFGAGISMNEKSLYILEEGLSSPVPQLQLISLNFLSQYHNDRADEAMNKALSANNVLIRLEALLHLAEMKSPKAVGQIESLMNKVDSRALSVFPQLFAAAGTDRAIKVMKRFLTNSDEGVRIETIINAAKHGRDDLLPNIRTLASHHNIPQQEACAFALGVMKDGAATEKLEMISRSTTPTVRLAALHALYQLGKKEVRATIEEIAKNQDLFAITLLGQIPETENILYTLTQSPNYQVKVNAALALLEREDPRCLQLVAELLVRDQRDLAIIKNASIGKCLSSWKIIPSARQNFTDNPIAHELALNMRESILGKAVNLPEANFLELADFLFEVHQNELIPTLVSLLETLGTPKAIGLLKKHQQKAGAPLIRNYCNLALYKLKEEGPYAENLKEWVSKKQNEDLIHFRPFIPWELREDEHTHYQLTPQETSRFLVEAFETLASTQHEDGINILLQAIQNGNQTNKYALAGLLMRATN